MTVPTLEHITFPGLDREQGLLALRQLELAESAARLFAAGLCGLDVQTGWSLGRTRPVRWLRAADGSLSVQIWVDLLDPANDGVDETGGGAAGPGAVAAYLHAFRSGFLHGLGRVLFSPGPEDEPPLARAWRRADQGRRLPARVRRRLAEPEVRRAAGGIFEILEGARTDMLLVQRFQGARRHLEGRLREARRAAAEGTPVAALVALLALVLRGVDEGDLPQAALGVRVACAALLARLRACMGGAAATGPEGAYALAEFVAYDLLPAVLEADEAGDLGPSLPAGDEGSPAQAPAPRPPAAGLRVFRGIGPGVQAGTGAAVGTVVVQLPHVEGGEALIRIDHARAAALAPDDLTSRVLRGVREEYGPRAREAFAAQAGPLRRALAANWERRERGRYRSGKHVGIANLRRYLTREDLRLFQRLEAPSALSYYVHLLVDVSYSMFQERNAEKALAVGYAFTELLRSLRVPVDVTLYASGVTELYDHRTDTLEPYFGGSFGYLVSGTLEMEAIAFARQKAERVAAERKIIVVVTDGTPALNSLPAVGAHDLGDYYRFTLLPWLARAGMELLAIGIACDPAYHVRSVCLTESWDSIDVLMGLLEEMVREGRRRVEALWG